jgi:2-oxoglutarate ferredoxin oxidoreductase subunit beta
MYAYYEKRVYELKDHNVQDYYQALNKIREWDYNKDAPIALGAFYKKEIPTFGDRFFQKKRQEAADKDLKIKELLKGSI